MSLDSLYHLYRGSPVSRRLRKGRFDRIVRAAGLAEGERVLEVGCAHGMDFAQFAHLRFAFTGIDLINHERVCDFDFRQCDARSLPYADQSFDCVVSIGVLEHIQPIEDLCRATRELARVGKRFCVIVPSIGTWFEPHTYSLFWHERDRNRKLSCGYPLNYFSDEAWIQFPGFENAQTKRFWHLPGLQNLMIFSKAAVA